MKQTHRLLLRILASWPRLLLLALFGGVVVTLLSYQHVTHSTGPYRYTHLEQVPPQRVAIVFGAGLRRDGQPSRILAERVQAAVDLYAQGTVNKLLLTGDNSQVEYNEVGAMRSYALAQGVPADVITLDYAGFSTYESCYRARVIFGIEAGAVLVTQRYHLPRALYTCRQLGIDAIGFGTPDWEHFPAVAMRRYALREYVAIVNALWQVHIVRPQPTFLGPFEGLT